MTPEQSAHAARMAGLFDALSATYDNVGVDFFGPIAHGLVEALAPTSGETWIDVGCGRGAVLLEAASRVAPGAAVGLDISPAMVDAARALASARGLPDVEVLVDDAQDPAYSEGLADVVSSSLVLFFLTDPAAALVSWRRLLRPGGRLGVTTFGGTDPRWQEVDDVFDPFLPPQMRDARTSGNLGPFASDAGMERLLADAGYTEVRTVATSVPVRFDDAQHWYDFSWSTGQRAMWSAVPEVSRPEVRAECERRLMAHAAADGSVTFEQPVRHTLGVLPQA
jgi:ubiquinone/menaquinone biosynthesis C-methylase UbiE